MAAGRSGRSRRPGRPGLPIQALCNHPSFPLPRNRRGYRHVAFACPPETRITRRSSASASDELELTAGQAQGPRVHRNLSSRPATRRRRARCRAHAPFLSLRRSACCCRRYGRDQGSLRNYRAGPARPPRRQGLLAQRGRRRPQACIGGLGPGVPALLEGLCRRRGRGAQGQARDVAGHLRQTLGVAANGTTAAHAGARIGRQRQQAAEYLPFQRGPIAVALAAGRRTVTG